MLPLSNKQEVVKMECENCKGTGEVQEHNFDNDLHAPLYDIVTCTFCNGTGEIKEKYLGGRYNE
ncbi:MAG: hypothetical protein IH948_03620 [Bacteroidetes bacterium]|nr:hypothetical protein [Bacteroidota bacterium]